MEARTEYSNLCGGSVRGDKLSCSDWAAGTVRTLCGLLVRITLTQMSSDPAVVTVCLESDLLATRHWSACLQLLG